jgi:Fur family ferric uptake transcriptional regulator
MSRNLNIDNPIHGHPLTMQRRLLLELLREAGGHMDAKELYRLASSRDRSISPATVYRSLHLFKELGLIDEMRLDKVRCYYEIKQSPGHQHMICQGCGKVIEFHGPYFRELIESVRHEYGFNVTKATLYLEGFCPDCDENILKEEASIKK